MTRKIFTITTDEEALKIRLLSQCNKENYSAFLDSNDHMDKYHCYDWLIGLGEKQVFIPGSDTFSELEIFHQQKKDWLFGHLSYELKNDLEDLHSANPDKLGFEKMLFFIPETVVYKKNNTITAESFAFAGESEFLDYLTHTTTSKPKQGSTNITLGANCSRNEYLEQVASLKDHLQFGNIYEINYCIEYSEIVQNFDSPGVFKKLNESAKAPFSAFYKNNDKILMCASPERYLQKRGRQIISQPIKGTIMRSPHKQEDERLKNELLQNEKERSENVMITDLVRNDLSRTAERATVKVDELFGIYSFNTVHQMISTISSRLDENYTFADVLKTTFPMGSMTGAPKVKAMQLIEEHENFARNLYSGAVGYISPQGDFDFNVVIRSLFYNGGTNYLSARVGSAITIHCEAEKEYEECLLKAQNLFNSLKSS